MVKDPRFIGTLSISTILSNVDLYYNYKASIKHLHLQATIFNNAINEITEPTEEEDEYVDDLES